MRKYHSAGILQEAQENLNGAVCIHDISCVDSVLIFFPSSHNAVCMETLPNHYFEPYIKVKLPNWVSNSPDIRKLTGFLLITHKKSSGRFSLIQGKKKTKKKGNNTGI